MEGLSHHEKRQLERLLRGKSNVEYLFVGPVSLRTMSITSVWALPKGRSYGGQFRLEYLGFPSETAYAFTLKHGIGDLYRQAKDYAARCAIAEAFDPDVANTAPF